MRCYVDILLITSTANIKTWERDNGLYGGLSPLARGTRLLAMAYMAIGWFIPAGAGNTRTDSCATAPPAVYPRWRGEHIPWTRPDGTRPGLSPLERGTRNIQRARRLRWRFIPAGAGNTHSITTDRQSPAVYPRWRGEHDIWLDARGVYIGLSPLARGTQRCARARTTSQRFIPAGAGNTVGINAGAVPATVYPRWRGEHGSCEGLAISSAGLSPLARGTRVGHPQLAFPHRFIPAGAGNTAHIRTGPVNRPVYPRWRGEHQNGSASIARISGLSPLARGTRLYISKYWSCIWFIPAGAGNTLNITYY